MGFEFLNNSNSYTAKVFEIGLQSLIEKEVKKSQDKELEKLARVSEFISIFNKNKVITKSGVEEFNKLTEELLSDKEDLYRRIDSMFSIVASKYDIIGIDVYNKLIKFIDNDSRADLVINFYKLYKRSLKQQDHSWIKSAVLEKYKALLVVDKVTLFDNRNFTISLTYSEKYKLFKLQLLNKKGNNEYSALIKIDGNLVTALKMKEHNQFLIKKAIVSLEAHFDTMTIPDTYKISKPNKEKVIKVIRELCSEYNLFGKVLERYYNDEECSHISKYISETMLIRAIEEANSTSLNKFLDTDIFRGNEVICKIYSIVRDTFYNYMRSYEK